MQRDAGSPQDAGARQRARAGSAGKGRPASAGDDASAADGGVAGAAGELAAVDAMTAGDGARSVAGSGGTGGSGGMGGMRPGADGGNGGRGPAGRDDAGSGAADSGSMVEETLHTPSCPTLARELGAAFCYDFEQGNKGPDGGDAFGLWDTPDKPPASALTTQELPAGSANHVLFASPPLVNMFPSATIGHDTPPFSRAVAELDIWANRELLNVNNDVVYFRYVPDDRDYDHVTSLIVRGGTAFLRTEDNKNLPLARVPSVTDKTHVRVELERAASCSVRVFFDDIVVVSAAAINCAPNGPTGFVEYGLIVLDTISSPVSATYDNIAFDME